MEVEKPMLTHAFIRKTKDLDRKGLKALRGDLIVAQERARMRFARSRSVRDGESYRRRGHELGEVRTRLRRLDEQQPGDAPCPDSQ